MELHQLIEGLSVVTAYSPAVTDVRVVQTHISVVFLAGDFVYKLHKPVRTAFLDFTTLDQRRDDCLEEVRLNRRLAPEIYLGVVGVVATPDGLRFVDHPDEQPLEWAVKMRRLPEQSSLLERLAAGKTRLEDFQELGEVIARFHQNAASNDRISSFGKLENIARNVRENFTESEPEAGVTIDRHLFERLRSLSEFRLQELAPLIEKRVMLGVPREGHGDLHLDHVYHFPEHSAPRDWVILDCVEFAERFRCCDPVDDAAFLVMDLKFRGYRAEAEHFLRSYFAARHDDDGLSLLRFYTAYRALVRAKVEGMTRRDPNVCEEQRQRNRVLVQGRTLLALGELEEPDRRPLLLLIGGLPGTGKSTLATTLSGFSLLQTDRVRREIHGSLPDRYTPERTREVYSECLTRAEAALLRGERVLIDANFRDAATRQSFVELAQRLAVPLVFAVCQCDGEQVRARLNARRGDVSEADVSVYEWAAAHWEPPTLPILELDTTDEIAPAREKLLAHLIRAELASAPRAEVR